MPSLKESSAPVRDAVEHVDAPGVPRGLRLRPQPAEVNPPEQPAAAPDGRGERVSGRTHGRGDAARAV
jgi:hypothetical protein